MMVKSTLNQLRTGWMMMTMNDHIKYANKVSINANQAPSLRILLGFDHTFDYAIYIRIVLIQLFEINSLGLTFVETAEDNQDLIFREGSV